MSSPFTSPLGIAFLSHLIFYFLQVVDTDLPFGNAASASSASTSASAFTSTSTFNNLLACTLMMFIIGFGFLGILLFIFGSVAYCIIINFSLPTMYT